MRRKNEYDASKLTQVATNKTVVSVYVDSFPIEKVKFRFVEFANSSNAVDIYLNFEDIFRITQDIRSGRLFKDIQDSPYPIWLQEYGGGPSKDGTISRRLSVGMKNDRVFLNSQSGPGKVSSTGSITPNGDPTSKVSVGMTINDFKKLFLYTEAGVNAYLPHLIDDLIAAAEEQRSKI
jgi:hypothetical protein